MNDKKKEIRNIEFKTWKSDKESILNNLIEIVQIEINIKLDFTPESLNSIEKFLISKFLDPLQAYDMANQTIMIAASSYIGEVYIRNSKAKLEWGMIMEESKINGRVTPFSFNYFIKNYKTYLGFNPFSRIPFLLNKRTGDKLYSHYVHKENLYKPDELLYSKPIEFKGYCYGYFLIPITERHTDETIMNQITSYLATKKNKYKIANNRIDIIYKNDFQIHIYIDKRKEILSEINEQLKLNEISLKNQNPIRIEIWADEDKTGNYLNEILFIIGHLNIKKEYLIIKSNE